METIISLKAMGSQVRRDILRMVHGAKSGHPGGSLGCVELLVALYFDIMNHDPDTFEMSGLGQDVFLQRSNLGARTLYISSGRRALH
jgi:transketolase